MSTWLRMLPTSIRRSFMQSRTFVDLDRLEGVTVRIAHHEVDRGRALALVEKNYSRRGWELRSELRLPSTVNIVAEREGEVVGTVSVIKDSAHRLPADGLHPAQVEWLRMTSGRLCEISGLTVDDGFRRVGLNFLLYRALFELALFGQVDTVVVRVGAHVSFLYEDLMHFRPIGPPRVWGHRGTFATLAVHVHEFVERTGGVLRALEDTMHETWTPARLFFGADLERFLAPGSAQVMKRFARGTMNGTKR
jgi:Acetyltransferase (GNAT) family